MPTTDSNTSRPIKVQQLIARLNIGGPAVLVLDLAAGLDKADFQVRLAAGRVGPGEAQMDHWAEKRGVAWQALEGLSPELGGGNWAAFKAIRQILAEGVDILHTHTAKAGTLGRLAALSMFGRKPKLVHTFHGHVFRGYFPAWKTSLFLSIERFLGRRTDRIIVLSPEQADDIGDKYRICGPEKIRIIPIGLELEPFDRACSGGFRSRLGLKPESLLIGLIGRLTSIKNQSLAIRGLAKMGRAGQDLTLALIGDGEDEALLKALVQELGLEDRVFFTGWNENMPGVYADLDAVILTSDNEGLPLALVEALASSLPVAATPVGGVPSLLGLENRPDRGDFAIAQRGLVFGINDSAGLSKALKWLTENQEGAAGLALQGRDHVMKYFSQQRYLEAHARLYSEMVDR